LHRLRDRSGMGSGMDPSSIGKLSFGMHAPI
jgi:hypothetical protein